MTLIQQLLELPKDLLDLDPGSDPPLTPNAWSAFQVFMHIGVSSRPRFLNMGRANTLGKLVSNELPLLEHYRDPHPGKKPCTLITLAKTKASIMAFQETKKEDFSSPYLKSISGSLNFV